MRYVLPVLILPACSEYKLNHDDTGHVVGDTDTVVTIDSDADLQCADAEFPGYAGSSDACPAADGPFDVVLEWTYDTWSVAPDSKSIMMTPIVVELDGDGIPDIAVVTYPGDGYSGFGILRAISGDGTHEIFNVVDAGLQACSGLAAGDIDGDGLVEIVGVTGYEGYSGPRVRAFENDGTLKWTSAEIGANIGDNAPNPAISDMDGDGHPEIIVGSAIINSDGTLKGAGDAGKAAGLYYGVASVAVDIDRDGTQELVSGNALYRPDGSAIWHNGKPDGLVAIGNFDADPKGEIVVVVNSKVRLQDDDGTVLWETDIPQARYVDFGGPPTIADFDGDGLPEIGVAANSTYTVFEDDGTVRWQASTTDGSSGVTGSSVFDFDGDGVAEVVYADEEHVWVFAGTDGTVRFESGNEHSSWTILEYPVIADVDADGHAEIVVARNENPTQTRPQSYGIAVYGDADDAWLPGRQIWNQHAYHITNVEDDGTIPTTNAENWDSFNSFRSGDLVAGSAAPLADPTIAQAGICDLDCDADRILVWVNPGNASSTHIHEATVGLYRVDGGVETLVSEQTVNDLVPGAFADSLQFEVTGDVATIEALTARIAIHGAECDLGNDIVRWDGPLCP
jgi:hypothetical protein